MNDSRVWTAEQQRAIERRDGDLLLDAGAGSGKTSVLVERFVAAVLQDEIAVASILTITFTEKAAAELRDRIRSRLHELGAAERARETEGAFISTIHGFCARVLRAHALAAGLDPGFAVLDRSESEPLVSGAFEDALEELARESDGAVDLIADYGARPLRAAVLAAYAQLRSAGALAPRLPAVALSGDELTGDGCTRAAGELARAAAALAAELGTIAAPSVRVIDAGERVQRCLELVTVPDVWPSELERVKLPRNGAALSTDACVAYTEALASFRSRAAARAAAPVRDLLDRLLIAYGVHYERRKRELSGLDFEDLELITRDLLRTDGELRERYGARFDRIMVDELQDTNRVQLELIESIARENLFTVGDAQQSIYGFRHAEVQLFEDRGRRLETIGARETLQTNFRSRPEILGAVNLAFADELGERFEALRPGRTDPPDGTARVELLVVDKGADWALEGVASPWRLAEARALADRIAQLVADGAAPGEIVVLMRATTDMRAYERALERRGLPTYVIGGRGYWSHPQVVDLVSYLRSLANPRDEASLYGVLASPLVGVSLDALVVLAAGARESRRDPWWVLREPGDELDGLQDADRARLAAFATWFAGQRVRSARAGIEELIDSALALTGYDVAMLAMPGGERRLANVRKLMRLAREHEGLNGPDLRGFLELVADREAGRTSDSRESEAPVEGDGLDAIRLMTIHRAKGLEFRVVCVADLGRVPRPPSELLRVTADGRLGLRLARAGVGGREPALDYKAIGDEQRAAEEREERRLFYVAMTRAQEHLVLSGAAKFDGWTVEGKHTGGGPIAWIGPAFVPELGAVIADGGGVVVRDGVRIAVRVGRPEDEPATPEGRAWSPAPAPAPGPLAAGPMAAGEVGVAPLAAGPMAAGPMAAGELGAGELGAAPRAAGAVPPPVRVLAPAPPVASLSYSSLGEYARCGYRFYAERVLGLPAAPEPRMLGLPAAPEPRALGLPAAPGPRAPGPAAIRGLRSPADRGVLLHALLERLDFRRPVVPAGPAIVAAAARAGLSPAPGPEEADELIALVRRFAASDLCRRLGRVTDTRREARFAFALAGGALVNGALDVLAREPGGRALIVDYKSDRLAGADPVALVRSAYATQRLVYALAALRMGSEQVEIAHCFLEAPQEPVTATFSRAQAPELEAELHALARGVLEREFVVAPAPYRALCSGCPAEGGLCSWPPAMTRREAPDRLF